MVWIKRNALTFQFKGRPRRGLFWRKKVYGLWFEYAKASPRKVPEEFGDLSSFNSFEEWWRHPDYGFELFCEPVEEPAVKVVAEIDQDNPEYIFLRVNLNEEPQKLKLLFKGLLKKHQSNKRIQKKSQARFQPSVAQKHMKLGAWEDYLKMWKLRETGCSRKETYEKHSGEKWIDDDEDALRNISRACQRVRKMFKSIERGTFP